MLSVSLVYSMIDRLEKKLKAKTAAVDKYPSTGSTASDLGLSSPVSRKA